MYSYQLIIQFPSASWTALQNACKSFLYKHKTKHSHISWGYATWNVYMLLFYICMQHKKMVCISCGIYCLPSMSHEICTRFDCPACRTYEIASRFWNVVCPIHMCLTVYEFSFILFDLCLFIPIFNYILNYVLIVTFWIFTYYKIWIMLIINCFIWNYCPACRTSLIATRFWVVMICPTIKCLTVFEFSFILFDLCLFITIFNFILNYVPIVTFWIFTYHKIWILLIIFCFIWSYWIIYFLTCLEVFWSVVS